MEIDATGGDQGSLRDQQDDPERKHGAVHMDKRIRQGSAENPGAIVGARKADID